MNWQDIGQFLYRVLAFDKESPLLFTQFYFWAFFAIVFTFFSLLHNKILLRNAYLFFVSLLFYYKTSGLFLLLLIFTIIVNYFLGIKIYKSSKISYKRGFLTIAIAIDILILVYFKYAYFFTDVYNQLFHTNNEVINILAKWSNNLAGTRFTIDKILLPVGISFFTFQAISYIMDIYRKRVEPVKNLLNFGFYISFFPQLVAGPIVRAHEFIPQMYKPYHLSKKEFGIAVFWILNGLLKKIILSDYIAVNFIDRIFTNPMMYTGLENLMAIFGYSLQVYADFSGYTDIAIGVALLMGFRLPTNFNSPYKSTNPGEFWKRWHISLSTWLKDYLYVPLGGNRRISFGTYFWILLIITIFYALSGEIWILIGGFVFIFLLILLTILIPSWKKFIQTNINLMDTMLIGGLWHGASLNFMIWGGLNGIGIVIYKLWRKFTYLQKALIVSAITLAIGYFRFKNPTPAWNIAFFWMAAIAIGTWIEWILAKITSRKSTNFSWFQRPWSILLTFVFITFTRLFFRSGSNLNPAEANIVAWETATQMINQIGSAWNINLVGNILYEYRVFLILFFGGMIIHWLPKNWKRWYRLNFAMMPIYVQLIAVVAAVFVVFQFITADLQPFIYFQF